MNDYKQAVFISYAWGGESEAIVNPIDTSLQKRGIKIVRDKRDLGYKGSIHKFMEQIGQGNCVIAVISDQYLRSPNCMFELIEIAEGKQFIDRIFPIVLADAHIYDPIQRIEYVQYWEDKRGKLAEKIKTLDPANLQGIREEMDLYDHIRDKISGLVSILKDMNTLTPDMHMDSDFDDLYNAIETRMKGENGSSTSGNTYYYQTQTPNGQRVDVAPPFDQRPYSMRRAPVKDIPRDFPSLVDRTQELGFITDAIQTSTPVLIFGEKEIGKTSLVRHLIHHFELPSFTNGILYVDKSTDHLEDLLQFLFDRFFISPHEPKLRDADIREALQKPKALIFLDHLELDPHKTISLLNAVPHCTFVFSSMEQILSGEGRLIHLEGLPEKDGATLFKHELANFLNAPALNEEEHVAVRKLCAIYQGHPKRIIDAADQIARGKKSILELLEASERGDPDTVLLQAALSTLTAFQESILDLLIAVGGSKLPLEHLDKLSQDPDITKTLQELISVGLIQVHNSCYSLTGRAPSLAASKDVSVWEDHLLDHFTHWLERKPEPGQVEEASEALLYLLKKASEKQKWSKVIHFGRALEPYLIQGKRWQAWAGLLNQLLDAAKAMGDQKVEAWVLHQSGSRAMCLGEEKAAHDLLTRALKVRKEINDQGGIAVTQHNLNVLRPIPVPPNGEGSDSGGSIAGGIGSSWIAGGLAARSWILLFVAILLAGAFQVPPLATAIPTLTNTITATASFTLTRTPTASLIPTTTPTITSTSTKAPSPMPSIPRFAFTRNAFCYRGPSTSYHILTGMLPGEIVDIVGRNVDNSWYRVFWERHGVTCWVQANRGQPVGNPEEALVVFAATITPSSNPPTLVPTNSPTPPPTNTPSNTPCPIDICDIGI